ncbi:caspase a-like [Engraulis encrasicolus]|uniref:caspase a-like n=1 Tax=Engraulis encrasicolus TaxID=184585 RepID=UPI002FD7023C
MSADLARMRKLFIDKVSLPVVKQLLDDLVEDRVLNEEEKDSVLEENKSKADKARCLIDMVKKKGDKASLKMIQHIKERDENLYEVLQPQQAPAPTVSVPLPQSQVSSQDEFSVSAVLIPTTEQFKSAKLQEGNRIYPPRNKNERKRLALLINNVHFETSGMHRRGSEKDEERMEALLQNLGYDVIKYRDQSAEGMDKAVKDFSERKEHELSDSTFVVMMSHGKRDNIMGVKWNRDSPELDVFPVDKIYKYLNTTGCPGLRNKPKVILIQACRGGDSGLVWVPDGMQDDGMAGIQSDDMAHQEKDFISLLSCTPDTKSYRHVEDGSFFFQRLVDVFNTHAHKEHMEDLCTMVMRRFEDFPRQMVCKDRTTLTRHFYLFPGL